MQAYANIKLHKEKRSLIFDFEAFESLSLQFPDNFLFFNRTNASYANSKLFKIYWALNLKLMSSLSNRNS